MTSETGTAMQQNLFDAGTFFRVPLLDLGTILEPQLEGILIPEPEVGRKRVGVTDRFLTDAEDYHQRYGNVPHFRRLLDEAFDRIGQPRAEAFVLDIGSGSGNTVFPCLELLPKSAIVATDISPDLLRILKRALDIEPGCQGRSALICMDATHDFFQPSSFDLVVGAAILHHLIEPQAAITTAARALKPGGHAIFFEPFENGHSIMRIAYTEILKEVERGRSIDPAALDLIKIILHDYEVRADLAPNSALLERIDDKWMFTRSFFGEAAEVAGFSSLDIYPLHPVDSPFSGQLRVHLQQGARLGPEALDDWVWQIMSFYDDVFSIHLKRDLLLEGTVIMSR